MSNNTLTLKLILKENCFSSSNSFIGSEQNSEVCKDYNDEYDSSLAPVGRVDRSLFNRYANDFQQQLDSGKSADLRVV